MVPNLVIFNFSGNCNWSNSRILISNTTIQFPNSSQKIRQSVIIWLILILNLRIFYFCTKLCNKANPRALVSNLTMAFSNCRLKIPKESNFCPKFKCFLFLHETLKNTDLEMAIMFFIFWPKNTQIRNFLWTLKIFFFLSETLSELNFISSNLVINL